MNIQNEILNNINTKYVLLKKGREYSIIDKNRKTIVVIDDPLINVKLLIKAMINKNAEVFTNVNNLPEPKEKLIRYNTIPSKYQLFIKRLYDENRIETGAIISALTNKAIDKNEKGKIEHLIQNYAFTVLYPNEGLNIYSEINGDIASVTIIKGINNLPYENIGGEKAEIFNW